VPGSTKNNSVQLCNNNQITACIAYLCSFCEEVYVVAFFKVMQQQITGEVANSTMFCGEIISVGKCKKIIKSDSIWQSYAQIKKFFSKKYPSKQVVRNFAHMRSRNS